MKKVVVCTIQEYFIIRYGELTEQVFESERKIGTVFASSPWGQKKRGGRGFPRSTSQNELIWLVSNLTMK